MRRNIDFLGMRKYFFALSIVLVLVAVGALVARGLNFGIEFQGGTVMTFNTTGVTTEELRDALDAVGIAEATIQPVEGEGFLVRTSESDVNAASEAFDKVVAELGLQGQQQTVTTIGPNWGANITNRAVMALVLSLAALLIYISFRFEYKMSLTAILALVHDVLITLGIYALVGREVTPNTIAALLTILGYSIYDTIVVFHRIKENSQRLVKRTFLDMANESINQVFARSINTSLTSLIPVVALLFFGGETLKDFAFALTMGLLLGAYSSIGVAAPVYSVWKEREPKYQALRKKLAKG
ncbi:MAG: protein translocase subunit SecF [Coriobacteriia bacterium]